MSTKCYQYRPKKNTGPRTPQDNIQWVLVDPSLTNVDRSKHTKASGETATWYKSRSDEDGKSFWVTPPWK